MGVERPCKQGNIATVFFPDDAKVLWNQMGRVLNPYLDLSEAD